MWRGGGRAVAITMLSQHSIGKPVLLTEGRRQKEEEITN